MDADRELAIAQLNALVRIPGALKVVTNEIRPDLRKDPNDPNSPIRPDVLAADPNAERKVSTMVLHDVVRIEGPDHRGQFRAFTAEGDWTQGQPVALLRRLQEWTL